MFFTQGIEGIADIIGTHSAFESLPHNDFQKYRVHSRIGSTGIVPTYDNLVINALLASDVILTPLKFSSSGFMTAKFLQKQLYDDAPNQVGKWFLLYSDWQQKFAGFENAPQTPQSTRRWT